MPVIRGGPGVGGVNGTDPYAIPSRENRQPGTSKSRSGGPALSTKTSNSGTPPQQRGVLPRRTPLGDVSNIANFGAPPPLPPNKPKSWMPTVAEAGVSTAVADASHLKTNYPGSTAVETGKVAGQGVAQSAQGSAVADNATDKMLKQMEHMAETQMKAQVVNKTVEMITAANKGVADRIKKVGDAFSSN